MSMMHAFAGRFVLFVARVRALEKPWDMRCIA